MFFDVHCHLTHQAFSDDVISVINNARDVIIHVAGSGLSDNKRVIDLSKEFSNVKASLGLFPWDAVNMGDGLVDTNLSFIKEHANDIICIGEVGLDHYWGKAREDWDFQEWVLNKIIDLSLDINKPLLFHTRKAEKDVLRVINNRGVNGIIHSYTGPHKLVNDFLSAGCYFSIPSVVARSPSFQSLVKRVPLNRLLTETDAPFLPIKAGQRSEPVNVKNTVKVIAEVKGVSVSVVEEELTNNYYTVFGGVL